MTSPQLLALPFTTHDTRKAMPVGRRVQFQDLPARMQNEAAFSRAGTFQPQQDPDVFMRDRSFSFDQGAPSITADDEWESNSPKPALPVEGHDAPKPKKTRRRKPKAPLDHETAQKKRREALDKNKQAAAKCRARKKADESKRQQQLQIMKTENQMLHSVLSQMEEQVRNAKLEVERHTGCEDDALMKAKKLIEDIESNCQRLNEQRRNIQASFSFAHARLDEEEVMSGPGEHDESGDFDTSHTNAGSTSFSNSQYSVTGNELQPESFQGSRQQEYPSPPYTSNVSDVIDYGTTSTEPVLNPLWVVTKNLPKANDSLFDAAATSAGSFNSLLSSPADIGTHLGGNSAYPDLPSPTGFAADMPLFDPSDPMLPTSSILDHQNFDTSASLFNDFDFEMPNVTDKMDTTDMDMLTQMDSAYDSQSPRSSRHGSKHSSPTWESLKLHRSQLDPCLRRDSALGPEVNEEQLLKDLSINSRVHGYGIKEYRPSLLERRRRQASK